MSNDCIFGLIIFGLVQTEAGWSLTKAAGRWHASSL